MAQRSVYQFEDFREFLSSTYEFLKMTKVGYSLSRFSEQLGFGSSNYSRLILDGKRSLTNESIHRIAQALELSFKETEYFESLVHLGQASTDAERKHYKRRLRQLKLHRPRSTGRFQARHLFSNWVYPAVMMAVEREPCESAESKAQGILPLGAELINKIVGELLRSGLIGVVDGKYLLNHSHQIFHDTNSASARHKTYLETQLRLSHKAFKKGYENGKFYSHTFSIAEEDFHYYHQRVRELLSDFTARSDATTPAGVAQLNVQLFKIGPEHL